MQVVFLLFGCVEPSVESDFQETEETEQTLDTSTVDTDIEESGQAIVEGWVVDENDVPIEGARVMMCSMLCYIMDTDEFGFFSFFIRPIKIM